MKLGEIAEKYMVEPNEETQKQLQKKPRPTEKEKMQYQLEEGKQIQAELEMIEKERLQYIEQ